MVKLAIFDMDGTLLDTLGDVANAANHALARMGYPVREQRDYLDYIGHGPDRMLACALPEQFRDQETVERAKSIYFEYYAAHSQQETQIYPGISELLRAVRPAGMKTAVYSNKQHAAVNRLAAHYFPGLIDVAVGYREDLPPKPDPAPVFELLETYGLLRTEAAFIGDSGVDMLTGRNAGVITVGVSWGFRPRGELWDSGADAVADNADELLKILLDKN